MVSKILVFIGLLGSTVSAANVRAAVAPFDVEEASIEHLDLEVIVEGGERQLFPLLPGTKCPAGHRCHARTSRAGVAPMVSSLKDNLKFPLAAALNWHELNNNLNTVVVSNDYCTRRAAMARAAGIVAGVSVATASSPAYAAETKEVKMGTDSGGLQFVPAKTTICKGDSVTWINNKGGPHNVVFDEEAIPSGVDQEKISMEDQIGDEGETFTMKFDVAGDYSYYCEPHRGAGMEGTLTVV